MNTMSKLKDGITWGEIGVIISCLTAVCIGTVYVASAKAETRSISEHLTMQDQIVKEKFITNEQWQRDQDARMDKLTEITEMNVRNTTVLAVLFKERTGKDVPQEFPVTKTTTTTTTGK